MARWKFYAHSDGTCCCGGGPCIVYADDFNRADSTDLGSKWEEVSGDWEIDTNRLQSTSEGFCLTTTRPKISRRSPKHYAHIISATLAGYDDGVRLWKIIIWYDDASNYLYAQFVADEAGVIQPSIIQVEGGSPTTLMDSTTHPGNPAYSTAYPTITICYSPDGLVMHDSLEEHRYTVCVTSPTTARAGGVVGFLVGTFDNWSYEEHWTSYTLCPDCGCHCLHPSDDNDYSCYPETLTATFENSGDFACDVLDDVAVDLEQGEPAGLTIVKTGRKNRWLSQPVQCNGSQYAFELSCDLETGVLTLIPYMYVSGDLGAPEPWVTAYTPDWTVSTCAPLVLVYRDVGVFPAFECEYEGTLGRQYCCTECGPESWLLKWDVTVTV
jgi:hypothetical protein